MISGVKRRVEAGPNALDAHGWQQLRQEQLQSAELRVVVKHLDLLSFPNRLFGHGYL